MYGVTTTFPAPVEMYDRMHAEMIKRAGTSVDGLLVHVGRATTDGFQTVQVWESKEHYDRANTDVVFPLMRELGGDQLLHSTEQPKLRRPWACHPQRQHPDLAEWGCECAETRCRRHGCAPHVRGSAASLGRRQPARMRHAQHIPQKLTPVALPPGVSFGFVHLASRFEGLNAGGPKLSAAVLRRWARCCGGARARVLRLTERLRPDFGHVGL
jgi:hypothetical protein